MAHITDDAAETWLQEHDPDYENQRLAWRHVRGSQYVSPWDERGGYEADDYGWLVGGGMAEWLEDVNEPIRQCVTCGRKFQQRRPWHVFCQSRCRVKAWREIRP